MGRLNAVSTAARPKMHGRAMLSGPSGAGKTWTALGMATVLAEGHLDRVLMIDTEKESALTYADVFVGFQHLPWRPPFDPAELTATLAEVDGDTYDVVLVDTFSKFWRGLGGTLDIADGKFGGWKAARPIQEALIEAVLAVPAHVILCVRSKMEYLVEGGGNGTRQTVTRVGMAPVQDDTLVYEVNIAADLDMEHRLTITKSRTPAVPVGRMYPAGLERKAAEDYAEWLAGGVPPASRDDVEALVGMMAEVVDAEKRGRVKHFFVELFGMPHSLTANQVVEARAWLTEELSAADENRPATHDEEVAPTEPKPPAPQEADTPHPLAEATADAPKPATAATEAAQDDEDEHCAGCGGVILPDHEKPKATERGVVAGTGESFHARCAPFPEPDPNESIETLRDRMAEIKS